MSQTSPIGTQPDQHGMDPQAKATEVAGQAQEKAHQAAGQVRRARSTSRRPICARSAPRCANRVRTVPRRQPSNSRSTRRRSAATSTRRIPMVCSPTRRTSGAASRGRSPPVDWHWALLLRAFSRPPAASATKAVRPSLAPQGCIRRRRLQRATGGAGCPRQARQGPTRDW
jgi:hypothetical protein